MALLIVIWVIGSVLGYIIHKNFWVKKMNDWNGGLVLFGMVFSILGSWLFVLTGFIVHRLDEK